MDTPKTSRWRNVLAVAYLLFVTLVSYGSTLNPSQTFLPADLLLLRAPYKQHTAELMPGFHAVARPATDPLFQFYPARKFLRDSIRTDYLPLWNPYSFSGTPFAADDQSAVFYPLNWLYAVLPLASAFGWIAALHTFLAGLFFWLWGRRLGWGNAAALSGATAWMLCGTMVSWQMWQVVDDSLCWLPLALYFWEGWRDNGDKRQAVGVSVALAMSLLAGHLQFGFYVWLTTAVYALYRPALIGLQTNYRRTIATLAGIVALGVGLGAVQVFATADMLLRSSRANVSYQQLLGTAMSAKQLIMLIAPDLFGGQRDDLFSAHGIGVPYTFGSVTMIGHGPYIGEVNLYELTAYCGAAALVFALIGMRLRERGDMSRLWLGLIVFALLMACGSPLYALFYHAVPLYKSFRGVARVLVLLDFAVAALCGAGIERLLAASDEYRRTVALRAAGGVAFAAAILFRVAMTMNVAGVDIGSLLTHEWMSNGHLARFLGVPILIVALAGIAARFTTPQLRWVPLVVIAADMLLFAVGFNTSVPSRLLYPPMPETTFVSQNLGNDRVLCLADDTDNYQSRLMPNAAMSLGWHDIAGNNPLVLARYDHFLAALNTAQSGTSVPDGEGIVSGTGIAALDRLDVKYLVTPGTLTNPAYRLVVGGDVNVYENTHALGIARLVHKWIVVPGNGDALTTLFSPAGPLNDPESVLLDRDPGLVANDAHGDGAVDRIALYDGTVEITTSTSTPALLITAIPYEPGWRATVDRKPANPLTADSLFVAVPLAAGSHTLILRYLPQPVQFGLYVTLVSWSVMGFLVAAGSAYGPRRERDG